ncbi:hypothetical protein TNCT_23901 [Trichonephila clavata]|uniref:Uncharacterized protein n=1 Tax=Trichonephila clavata TaxID=2740835 RepID=A0A8X6GW81_TRICU|nr:hypothetical protein TNCT_23901 [Trichonephila clavata]
MKDSLSGRGYPDIHNCLPFKACFYETKTFVRKTYKHILRDNMKISVENVVLGIINRFALLDLEFEHLRFLCPRQQKDLEPEFTETIPNVTVATGQEAVLSCAVDNLGTYRIGNNCNTSKN